MAQTGISQPWKGRNGQIHTDGDAQGDSFRCEVGRCPRPCEHCKADRCWGFLRWTMDDLMNGNTISCSVNPDHKYDVILSG